ncbi:MAG: hypothetical protein A2Z42_02455 [Candidatus Woykebacteria bacterium RBG_19FT_COMBO_43_10]|uniref:DUF218 domain-containing protein n=1 Tax=Candidatus Woykebacteria bacterium RBG_19FT_COMBO_43_10 TaxID=1802598 RepID=A0A1G1WH97_9BACT|nr:MAG: hypothetical protein A2Z42_02455 [Candidatus Woykebacteria bacterium RBG_19FT_COMBO_43_10]
MVLQVTALRLGKSLQEIERLDVHIQGPMLVYNGTPTHNADLMAVLDLPNGLIPKSRVFIIEEVKDRSGESRLIRNTLDQILSFPTDQLGYQLNGTVAIVSSAPHLPRILRYLGKYRPIPDAVPIRCFPVPSDPEWSEQFAEEEIDRVCEYLQQGYLTAAPYPKNLGVG